MGRLLLQALGLVSGYLLDAVGLEDLYQLYCDLLTEIGACGWLDDPFPHRKTDSEQPYR